MPCWIHWKYIFPCLRLEEFEQMVRSAAFTLTEEGKEKRSSLEAQKFLFNGWFKLFLTPRPIEVIEWVLSEERLVAGTVLSRLKAVTSQAEPTSSQQRRSRSSHTSTAAYSLCLEITYGTRQSGRCKKWKSTVFLFSWYFSFLPHSLWHVTKLTTNFNCFFQPQAVSWDLPTELFTEFQVLTNRLGTRNWGANKLNTHCRRLSKNYQWFLTLEGQMQVSYLTKGNRCTWRPKRERKQK